MRGSAVLSALFHVAIIVAAMTSFANPARFNLEVPPNIPVELLTVSDVTNISAAIEETNEPEPVEEEVVEEQVPEPTPPPREMASLPDPVLELPEPEAEYLPSEDTEPEPEPVEAEPDPEPQPQVVQPTVRPNVRPRPPERRQGFDFAAAEALIDRAPREEQPTLDLDNLEIGENAHVETAERARSRVGLGTGLTISEIDALKAQIFPCWNFPAGVPNPEEMNVVLEVRLNRDGTLARQPAVIDVVRFRTDRYYRTVAESAIRAVTICERNRPRPDGSMRQGYDLPPERYSQWERLELEFNLAAALGMR